MTELKPSFTLPAGTLRAEGQEIGTTLHGRGSDGNVTRINEQEWHQHAARYFACGLSTQEVADACGVSYNTVHVLSHTSWFQERVTGLMAEQDRDIMDLFKGMRVSAIMKLGQLAEGAKSEVVQLGAVKEILERNFGKSVQRVEQDTTVRSGDPVAEAAALMRDIENLQGNPGTRSASAESGEVA